MYVLMLAFDPTRATPVARGSNEGVNYYNVVADSEGTGNRYPGGDGGAGRKLECWQYVGKHLKSNCPKRAEEKENTKRATAASRDPRKPTINSLTGKQR